MKKIILCLILLISNIAIAQTPISIPSDYNTLYDYYNLFGFNVSNATSRDNYVLNQLQEDEEISAAVLNAKFDSLNKKIDLIQLSTGAITSCADLSAINDIAGNSVDGDDTLTACLHNREFFTPNCVISSSSTCVSSCPTGEILEGERCFVFTPGLANWTSTLSDTLLLENSDQFDTLATVFPAAGDISVTFEFKGTGPNLMVGFSELGSDASWTPQNSFNIQFQGNSPTRLNTYGVSPNLSEFSNTSSAVVGNATYRMTFTDRDTNPLMSIYVNDNLLHQGNIIGLDGQLQFHASVSSGGSIELKITDVQGQLGETSPLTWDDIYSCTGNSNGTQQTQTQLPNSITGVGAERLGWGCRSNEELSGDGQITFEYKGSETDIIGFTNSDYTRTSSGYRNIIAGVAVSSSGELRRYEGSLVTSAGGTNSALTSCGTITAGQRIGVKLIGSTFSVIVDDVECYTFSETQSYTLPIQAAWVALGGANSNENIQFNSFGE